MPNVMRIAMVGSGWAGSPAASQFFFLAPETGLQGSVDAAADAVQDAYYGVRAYSPPGVAWKLDSAVAILDEVSGHQVAEILTATVPVTAAGTATGAAISRAEMIKLRFNTLNYVNGRQVRGGPYIGPIATEALNGSGDISTGAASAFTASFGGLLAGSLADLVVWHRPVDETGGQAFPVTSITLGVKPAILRSRRD